jgi:hypothetical protein
MSDPYDFHNATQPYLASQNGLERLVLSDEEDETENDPFISSVNSLYSQNKSQGQSLPNTQTRELQEVLDAGAESKQTRLSWKTGIPPGRTETPEEFLVRWLDTSKKPGAPTNYTRWKGVGGKVGTGTSAANAMIAAGYPARTHLQVTNKVSNRSVPAQGISSSV